MLFVTSLRNSPVRNSPEIFAPPVSWSKGRTSELSSISVLEFGALALDCSEGGCRTTLHFVVCVGCFYACGCCSRELSLPPQAHGRVEPDDCDMCMWEYFHLNIAKACSCGFHLLDQQDRLLALKRAQHRQRTARVEPESVARAGAETPAPLTMMRNSYWPDDHGDDAAPAAGVQQCASVDCNAAGVVADKFVGSVAAAA